MTLTPLATRWGLLRRTLFAFAAIALMLLSVSCDEEEVVDPEAADQVLILSISASGPMVPTYGLVEITTANTPTGVDELSAATSLAAFFKSEFACVEVSQDGTKVTVTFAEEVLEGGSGGVTGSACNASSSCASGVCGDDGKCAEATCTDAVINGEESDLDCGGSVCAPCAEGQACVAETDCSTEVCQGLICQPPPPVISCTDGEMNGTESDVDCGGDACSLCPDTAGCNTGSDCSSASCLANICATATCGDAVKNGSESDVDCGGSSCPVCTEGAACVAGTDCDSGSCAGGLCAAPACDDAVKNGQETDVDCGGSCGPCADGLACGSGTDCAGGECTRSLCMAATCANASMDGAETDVDCGGSCAACADGLACLVPEDCTSVTCTTNLCEAVAAGGEETEEAEGDPVEEPVEEPVDTEDNPCTYNGYVFVGELVVDVVQSQDPTKMEIDHTWKDILNGDTTLKAGNATVTWGQLTDIKRVSFTATWDAGDGSIQGAGNRSQRLADTEEGITGGIKIDGERRWTNSDGDWLLTLNGIESIGMSPAPVRGTYIIRTAAYLVTKMRFEKIDDSTIQVVSTGRDGTNIFKISPEDGSVIE